MRISDWSSDVCSSDVDHLMTADAVGVPGAAGVLQIQARAVGQVAQESEVGVAVAAEDLVAEALGALHHGGAEGEGAPAGAGQHREIDLSRRHEIGRASV